MLNLQPISLVTPPNYWTPIPDKFWTITGSMAYSMQGLLQVNDPFGTRPYVPASGAVLTAVFQRGDHLYGQSATLTVTKNAALDANFRSLATFTLTTQDTTNIISGTVQFTLTEGAAVQQWVQNFAVKVVNTFAGC